MDTPATPADPLAPLKVFDALDATADAAVCADMMGLARSFFARVYPQCFAYVRVQAVGSFDADGKPSGTAYFASLVAGDMWPCWGRTRSAALLTLITQCIHLVEECGDPDQAITRDVRRDLATMGATVLDAAAWKPCVDNLTMPLPSLHAGDEDFLAVCEVVDALARFSGAKDFDATMTARTRELVERLRRYRDDRDASVETWLARVHPR